MLLLGGDDNGDDVSSGGSRNTSGDRSGSEGDSCNTLYPNIHINKKNI